MCDRVRNVLGDEIAVCDSICMEVLAGAKDEEHLRNLRRLLARAKTVLTEPGDCEVAASLPALPPQGRNRSQVDRLSYRCSCDTRGRIGASL